MNSDSILKLQRFKYDVLSTANPDSKYVPVAIQRCEFSLSLPKSKYAQAIHRPRGPTTHDKRLRPGRIVTVKAVALLSGGDFAVVFVFQNYRPTFIDASSFICYSRSSVDRPCVTH